VISALAAALAREGRPFGLCSIGRDGEAADAVDAAPKPRYFLRPGATLATASALVPRSPALEIIRVTSETSALGAIVLARVRAPGFVEIAGPPSASALRRIVRALAGDGRLVLVDGAVDRIAALREGDDAIVVAVGAAVSATPARALDEIVVAVGAAVSPTPARALDEIAALTGRLRLPAVDPARDAVRIAGALGAGAAAAYARAGERRQIVVADPTRISFGGRTFLEISARLDLRCERTLRVVACSVAPLGPQRSFEPRTFARAVAERTGLPTYDIYAGTVAEPSAA